jgi:hypothetical protein
MYDKANLKKNLCKKLKNYIKKKKWDTLVILSEKY